MTRRPLRGCFPMLMTLGGLTLMGLTFLGLSGCEDSREGTPGGPGGADGESIFRIADLLEWLAWAFTLIGGACIAASIFVGIFRIQIPFLKLSPGRLAFAGVSLIVAGQLLLWLGANLWWITLLVLVGCLGVLGLVAWGNRRKVEPILGRDLDDDGIIGEPPKAHGHPTGEAK